MEETKYASKVHEKKEDDELFVYNETEKSEKGKDKDIIDEENLELDEFEWKCIESRIKLNQPFIEKSLQEIPVNVKGVYLSVMVSFLFIVLASLINRVEDVSNMNMMIKYSYESPIWNSESGSTFWDIKRLEDLNRYIRKVAIPTSYDELGSFNYFIGMRFTLKLSQMVEQPIGAYKNAENFIESNPKMVPGTDSKFQRSSKLGIWDYDSGFNNGNGYVLYILSNTSTLNEALISWRKAESIWLGNWGFSSLVIEYLFHNDNYACTLYYYQTFIQTPGGTMNLKTNSIGSFIEKFESWKDESLTILIIFIVYSLGFSLQIFKLVQNLVRTCKTLFIKKKLDLVWHEYIEIMSVVLSLISLILFGFNVIYYRGHYTLPISKPQDFTGVINYCRYFRLLVQFTALTALLISFKVIVVLRYKFPSFSILFDTILGAKVDIINFMLITIFLLVGFVFLAYLIFGSWMEEFSDIPKTFSKLFDMVLGQEDIKDQMTVINSRLAAAFLVVFLTVFFLVLANMFLAIVMSTYNDLKQKGQLILEAKAEMMAEKSEEWFQTLINLLLFRVKSVENDAIQYEKLLSCYEEDMSSEEKDILNEKIKMYETLIIASTKISLFGIFKTNFGKMSSLSKPSLLTHEQNMEKIYMTLRKILEREALKKKAKQILQRRVDYNFRLVIQMMIYLIYIIIFLIMILLRLKITDSFGMQSAIYNSFSNPTFRNDLTIFDIHNEKEMFEYLNEVFVPEISQDVLYNHNYFLGETRARITIQQYMPEENVKDFSANAQELYINKLNPKLRTASFRGSKTKLLYLYEEPGSKKTFNKAGGFVSYLSTQNEMKKTLETFEKDKILGESGYYLVLEWITYNPNLNLFAYSYLQFVHEVSGDISHTLYTNPIDMDFFRDKIPIRGLLEICYFLFTIYYFVIESKEWYGLWVMVIKEEKIKQQGSRALNRVLIKLIGQKAKDKGCRSIIYCIFHALKNSLFWVIRLILNIATTFKRYFAKDVFNIIDVTSIILSILNLSQIFQLSRNQFIGDYKVQNSDEYDICGEFAIINKIIVSYKYIVSINCLIIFVRLLQFYKFSKKLSLLTDILDSAKLDLIFFMLMFSIILFAYTLMSYLLLGHILTGFQSLPRSLISCYLMLIGEFKSKDIYDADYVFGTIFFVSLIVVFSLILLNMFIAIIGSHFERVSENAEGEEEDLGFFAKIWSVIMARKKGKFYLDEDEDEIINLQDLGNGKAVYENKQTSECEDEMFCVEPAVPDISSPAFWLKTLDNILMEKSDKKISIFKMKALSVSIENKQKITNQAKIYEVCHVNMHIWKNSSVSERLRMWRSMVMLSNETNLREIEKAFVEQTEIPNKARLSEYMETLWNANSREEKLHMWIGKDCFDHMERVAVWNTLTFNKETFDIEKNRLYVVWGEELTIGEKLRKVRNIISENSRIILSIKNFKEKDKSQAVLDNCAEIKDFKLMLWLGLSYNKHWLRNLYMNEPILCEAEIIAFLIIALNESSVFALDGIDYGLEDLLDGKMYDYFEAKAICVTEILKSCEIKNQIESSEDDIKVLHDYKIFVEEEVKRNKKINKELRDKFSNLSR
ncbi:hypothetical protein SteCoe_12655 [Stentor coeruleus]|uniref:Polycystin cation channel PKD1/PKD2 domain-containing protein n=1 Tax=Stentor coeruleus TaxID=5963 RepID=A0A1R2CAC6_9CILI|nr:hypothetical protein SteCoe_12655 [Stentor coeruleus]